MRETVVKSKKIGLVSVSDVALLKRLKLSSNWLRWMALKVIENLGCCLPPPRSFSKLVLKSGSSFVINEPGSTGSRWCLHHCLNLVDLGSDQFILSNPGVNVHAPLRITLHDLLIGDSDHISISDFLLYEQKGGNCIVHLSTPIIDFIGSNNAAKLLQKTKELSYGEYLDETLTDRETSFRIIILRTQNGQTFPNKPGRDGYNAPVLGSKFFVVATTLPQSFAARDILEVYRVRWVIGSGLRQLPFFLELGHVPKGDEESFHAWFHGKLLVAVLAEAIRRQGEFHSPWGYPIPQES
ncbi:MAG: hypothetical protein OEV64_00130 [Desulfobulbaceae bacterium]|nr:hypothetical protein [Desulfobulbaceae bacterium]